MANARRAERKKWLQAAFFVREKDFRWRNLPSCGAAPLGRMKGGGERMKRPKDMVRAILREQQKKNPTDPLGSWTGVPFNEDEEPVQDADDL